MRVGPLMEPAPCLLLLLLWGYCLAVIDGEGELRCYCNESGCVSTGYMCKSQSGQCYTAVEVQGEMTRATHGCLDTVPLDQRGLCRGRHQQSNKAASSSSSSSSSASSTADEKQRVRDAGGSSAEAAMAPDRARHDHRARSERERSSYPAGEGRGQGQGHGGGGGGRVGGGDGSSVSRFPWLICCGEDMCNYIENIDFSNLATLTKANGTSHTGSGGGGGERGVIYSRNGERSDDDDDRDLWFKAAVIAVPIAGGFILVLLVLLAVRMLRTDTQRHRRLIQVRRERSLTKAQLYVTDHFSDVSVKSDVNAKGCSLFSSPKHQTHNVRHHHHAGGGSGGGVNGGGGRGGGAGFGGGGVVGVGGKGVGVKIGVSGCATGGGKPVCRDVNISVDREGRMYEKVQCDVLGVHRHSHHHHVVPSVVSWGPKPSSSSSRGADPAASVV